jgi:hypothetical protein
MRYVLLSLLLIACAPQPTAFQDMPPLSPEECPLPMEYAIRSVCPFATAKVGGECAVVCYQAYHSEEESKTYPVQCKQDSDCTCDFYAANNTRCGCINTMCAAIVT